ncbi:MAG: hypothetical protein HOV92_12550 [Streptomyces sp.]|nr:hypothetical protein [Streptomyces sp.]
MTEHQPPQTPPAAQEPPKPGPPPTPAATFTQEDLERIAAKEKSQGERAGARKALEEFAAEHGFNNVDDAKAFIEAARKAQEDALSEQERAKKKLEADQQAIATERQTLAAERRTLRREQALSRLGAVDTTDDQGRTIPNLQDALAMLDRDLAATPDADETTVAKAAGKLKARRPELFGAPPVPQNPQMPPAPGGAPAGGPPPRQAPAGKPGDRGREMARLRGKIRDTAA